MYHRWNPWPFASKLCTMRNFKSFVGFELPSRMTSTLKTWNHILYRPRQGSALQKFQPRAFCLEAIQNFAFNQFRSLYAGIWEAITQFNVWPGSEFKANSCIHTKFWSSTSEIFWWKYDQYWDSTLIPTAMIRNTWALVHELLIWLLKYSNPEILVTLAISNLSRV